jgi:hypothetical protein
MQFPTPPHRIVYRKGGQYLAAARVDNSRVVIDHTLYWAAASSVDEAQFLTAVLNSPSLTRLVAPFQPRGEHNPRHFDKLVWRLPIPLYAPDDEQHRRLVELAECAEQIAATTDVSTRRTFQAQRRLIREALEGDGVAADIDALVIDLIEAASPDISASG